MAIEIHVTFQCAHMDIRLVFQMTKTSHDRS